MLFVHALPIIFVTFATYNKNSFICSRKDWNTQAR